MLLIESNGKSLFRKHGIPVPEAVLVTETHTPAPEALAAWPQYVVKAQIAVGGRGKAGGVLVVNTPQGACDAAQALLSKRIKGREVPACLIESAVKGEEHYLALIADPGTGGIRLLYCLQGGIDIESTERTDELAFELSMPLDREAFSEALSQFAAWLQHPRKESILECTRALGNMFFECELLVAEINPLFVLSEGGVVAGDAKVVIDLNCISRQPALMELLSEHRDWYPDVWRKIQEDFDYIELDPEGEIGLITTGAGLSMMLIDELVAQGARPVNFADVRTGQMRGDPARLLLMMDWLQTAPGLRVVLVNIFAGITDLEEFAQTLLKALALRPDWDTPIVARLIGNRQEHAYRLLRAEASHVVMESDLERAIALARSYVREEHV